MAATLLLACAGPGTGESAPEEPEAPAAADPRFDAAASYSAEHAGHALLVMEGAAVVYETGQNGHSARAPHPLHGATESFWGVLAVAAQRDGLLELDEVVATSVPDFAADPRKREMRIHQLLHLTSGLEAGFRALEPADGDRFERALALDAIAPPGVRFQYGPSHLFVLGEVLRRKLASAGEDPDPVAYLERRIFDPIGLEVTRWERDAAGQPDVAGGAVLTPREWAKFGRLLAEGGRVGEQEVLPQDALAPCFVGSTPNPRYGLALWLNAEPARPRFRDAPGPRPFYAGGLEDLTLASGLHNQRLYVVPSLGLVVVRFGGRDRRFRDEELLARLVDGARGEGS